MSVENRKKEYDRLVAEGREIPPVLIKEFGAAPTKEAPKTGLPAPAPQTKKKSRR